MSDLVEFLLARIAEDEAVARGAWPETWQVEGNNVVTAETGLRAGYEGLQMGVAHLAMTVGKYQTEARNAAHIARWDPARVLAECDAKRAVIEEFESITVELRADGEGGWVSGALNTLLKALALPYADHPDYRPEWRP